MFRSLFISFGSILLCSAAVAAAGRAGSTSDLMLVELKPGTDRATLERQLAARRGRLVAFLPQAGVAVARGGRRAEMRLIRSGDGVRVLRGGLAPDALDRYTGTKRLALAAWTKFAAAEVGAPGQPGGALERDALVPPDWWQTERPLMPMAATPSAADRPFGAGWENTSEYLAGAVSLNLILMESDGTVDPSTEDWTAALEADLLAGAYAATASLQQMYPDASLNFTIHLYAGRTDQRAQTSYEPIGRSAAPSGTTGEELWVNEILGHFGYSSGSRLSRSRQFADATRITDGTDWAVNIFVANSSNDSDGRFADGYFAYAWLGGPHVVTTSDNDGWGVARFDHVLRHELHHSFYAQDEYASSGCDCAAASGYLGATNDNCENACGALAPCVMRNNSAVRCEATLAQVGLTDSDLDGTPDVLSLPPDISLRLDSAEPSCDGLASFSGTASVVPYPNRNPFNATPRRDISILDVTSVEVRVDSGPWTGGTVLPADGQFDGPVEDFTYDVSLGTGRHQVEVRARDSRGHVSLAANRSVDVAEIGHPVGATLSVGLEVGGTRLTWAPATGAARYRLYRATSPQALQAAPVAVELAATTWLDPSPGTVFYRVTSVDACGRELVP